MNQLLIAILSNALVATLAAIVVFYVTRVVRSPQWCHALWLLVLLKLIAPPVFYIPILFVGASTTANIPHDQQGVPQVALNGNNSDSTRSSNEVSVESRNSSSARPAQDADTASFTAAYGFLSGCSLIIATLWAIGSAAWCSLFLVRIRRFHLLVHATSPAPEAWQSELAVLAARLGLHRQPELRLTEGSVPPLLWTIGRRPIILLPTALLEVLDASGRRALIAHELAHFHRRDHWVRWLEAAVFAVYWWHPVAWWARKNLQAAEEQCCDAWAVWLLDGNARSYGETLLATVDFLCAKRPAALWGASGMANLSNLKGRFEMLLHGTKDRYLSWSARTVIASLAIAMLPVSAYVARARAQAAPPSHGWARLSPFTEVNVRGDAATVQFDGKTYELVSIEDMPTKAILAVAQNSYGDLWEKRFVEDIVEVLEQSGRRPEKYVKLVLRDAQSGAVKTVDRAPLTAANRSQIYATRYRLGRAASDSLGAGYDLSHFVRFEVGASRLRDGDNITIEEVRGTSERIAAGNVYVIKGTYKLASKEQATLLASVTANKREDGQNTPIQKTQSVMVDQGNGHFSLILYMGYEGNPHVSFYPAAGESFANVYFGTGESVLKQGWWDKSK